MPEISTGTSLIVFLRISFRVPTSSIGGGTQGLWRYHELAAVSRLLVDVRSFSKGPSSTWVRRWRSVSVDLWDTVKMRQAWIQRVRATTTSCRHVLPDATRTFARRMARLCRLADDHFKLVFSNSVVEHISPVEPVLREVQRVLRPEGRFLFTTPAPRLYSRDTYEWRRMLAPVGLDWMGRRMASRENDAYHHVSIFDFQTWRTKLEAVGFEQVEQVTYLPVAVARVLTGFSGAIRQPLLQRHAWRLSREARALSAPTVPTELQWIESSRAILVPLLQPAANSDQCGQLLLATNGGG